MLKTHAINTREEMVQLNHSHATRAAQIGRAINSHRPWIESKLGVSMSDAVVIETGMSFHSAALPVLGYHDLSAQVSTPVARLTERLETAEVPPSHTPHLETKRVLSSGRALEGLLDLDDPCAYSMNLVDCPVLLRLRDFPVPIVSIGVRYHAGPDAADEDEQDVVIIAGSATSELVSLVKALNRTDGRPRLTVDYDEQPVTRCDWDQLVLDSKIIALLRDDFDAFFAHPEWFRKMRLPYRRGYLLHGPPGNGKSTAVRAMLTSQGLTAHTLRFFHDRTDDDDLQRLFTRAAQDAPAVVLLEDIDRVFPRTGQSRSKISLQTLLNCLDGVASSEGIITIATANEPTALDPAILKRPGRFDRVVCFPNPTSELRRRYFEMMHAPFKESDLDEVVGESAGFSYAQLREAFIMAAQVNLGTSTEIEVSDLLNALWSLRTSLLFGSMKPSAGFQGADKAED